MKKQNNTLEEKLEDLLKVPEVPDRSYTTMRDFHNKGNKNRGKYWTRIKSSLYEKAKKKYGC